MMTVAVARVVGCCEGMSCELPHKLLGLEREKFEQRVRTLKELPLARKLWIFKNGSMMIIQALEGLFMQLPTRYSDQQ
jgi:hypothetical protein